LLAAEGLSYMIEAALGGVKWTSLYSDFHCEAYFRSLLLS